MNPRLNLVNHVRDKIRAGAYDNPKILETTADRMVASFLDHQDLCGSRRAQLIAERGRADRRGDGGRLAQIDRALQGDL